MDQLLQTLSGYSQINQHIKDQLNEALITEARKIYPNAKAAVEVTIQYKVFKNNKGAYSESSLKQVIYQHKLNVVERWIRQQHRAHRVTHSRTTSSFYFILNDVEFRISDHTQRGYNGVSLLMTWLSDPMEIIHKIIYRSWTNKQGS